MTVCSDKLPRLSSCQSSISSDHSSIKQRSAECGFSVLLLSSSLVDYYLLIVVKRHPAYVEWSVYQSGESPWSAPFQFGPSIPPPARLSVRSFDLSSSLWPEIVAVMHAAWGRAAFYVDRYCCFRRTGDHATPAAGRPCYNGLTVWDALENSIWIVLTAGAGGRGSDGVIDRRSGKATPRYSGQRATYDTHNRLHAEFHRRYLHTPTTNRHCDTAFNDVNSTTVPVDLASQQLISISGPVWLSFWLWRVDQSSRE